MSKYDDETKYKALSLLQQGTNFSTVAAKLEVPVTTIIRWNRELKDQLANGNLDNLLDMDRVVLGEVINEVAKDPNLTKAAGKLTKDISYTDRLNKELQLTALHITAQVKSHVGSVAHASDLQLLTEVLCQLQTAFFNSNSTQINIQNNAGSGYEEFLTDAPAA